MKKSELVLHIGYPKTGTKYLQSFFCLNAAALRDHGLDYLELGRQGARNHARLAQRLLLEPVEASRSIWREISEYIISSETRLCLVSAELFAELPAASISALRELIEGIPLRVLVYVRWQPEAIESRYLQALKAGNKLPEFDIYMRDAVSSGAYHYWDRLREWQDLGAVVTARPYDRAWFPEGDVIEDALLQLGLDRDVLAELPRPSGASANNSIGPKTYFALQRIVYGEAGFFRQDAKTMHMGSHLGNRLHLHSFRVLNRVSDALGWNSRKMKLLTTDHIRLCEEAFGEQNRAVACDFVRSGDEQLFSVRRNPVAPNPLEDLSGADWATLVGGMLRHLEGDYERARAVGEEE